MSQILIISGTRPEIIKLAPLYHALKAQPDTQVSWLHTGQHSDMAQQILGCFHITPDITLARRGSSLAEFSIGCREQLESVLNQGHYTLIIVQGDTESAFLGALAGFYHKIPVAHVEAGLRTNNLDRPFPEEGIRQMISRIARFHFAPTPRAQQALLDEGIPSEKIIVTGNTVIDAQQWIVNHHGLQRRVNDRGHMLVTVHRRENWGNEIENVCHAIADLAKRHGDMKILFPVHLNPVVQQPVQQILAPLPNVELVAPLDYLDMQQALLDAWLVLTDSGGLQEEAPTFGVPLLVLREETERPEAIEAQCAAIVGTDRPTIVEQVETLMHNIERYTRMQQAGNPFGDGRACERIIAHLQLAATSRP